MNEKTDRMKDHAAENEILFSRSVKAGKRIYYLDVKRDRKQELYISLTESKRLKDQGDALHPVFEKHKIFLYREDLEKFSQAFQEVAAFAREHAPQHDFLSDWGNPVEEIDHLEF